MTPSPASRSLTLADCEPGALVLIAVTRLGGYREFRCTPANAPAQIVDYARRTDTIAVRWTYTTVDGDVATRKVA